MVRSGKLEIMVVWNLGRGILTYSIHGSRLSTSAFLTSATLLACMPAAAHAQDGAPSSPTADIDADEIIVTAQKRSENINRVGMSINAATGEQLAKLGVSGPEQLAKIIPNFVVNETLFAVPV